MATSVAPEPTQTTPAKKPSTDQLVPQAAQLPGSSEANLSLAAPNDALQPLTGTNTSLLNSTIAPPSNDRVGLATDAWKTFATATDPYYQKDLRDATSAAASKGQLGSGQLRTSYGDLANQRQIQLDTARDTLINQATSAAMDDAYKNVAIQQQQQGYQASQQQTAYAQALAKAQQDLATTLGKGNLALAEKTQAQSNDVAQQQLALQTKLGLGNLSLDQQRVAIAQKQADAEAAYQSGQLTLAQRDETLKELSQAQDYAIQQQTLDLQKKQTEQANALSQARLALDTQVQTGQLSLAQRDEALKELSQQQSHEIAQAQLQLSRDQLQQAGQQFGLSLAQQKELATMADATQNRQLDISSQQGINALLVQLAGIIGGPTGTVNPTFLAQVLKALQSAGSTVTGVQHTTTPTVTNDPNANQ